MQRMVTLRDYVAARRRREVEEEWEAGLRESRQLGALGWWLAALFAAWALRGFGAW